MTAAQVILTVASILGGILGGVVAASIGVSFQLRRDRAHQQQQTREIVSSLIKEVRNETKEEMRIIHGRISSLRDDTYREVIDRLARIEGQLTGVRTVTDIIQRKGLGEDA